MCFEHRIIYIKKKSWDHQGHYNSADNSGRSMRYLSILVIICISCHYWYDIGTKHSTGRNYLKVGNQFYMLDQTLKKYSVMRPWVTLAEAVFVRAGHHCIRAGHCVLPSSLHRYIQPVLYDSLNSLPSKTPLRLEISEHLKHFPFKSEGLQSHLPPTHWAGQLTVRR